MCLSRSIDRSRRSHCVVAVVCVRSGPVVANKRLRWANPVNSTKRSSSLLFSRTVQRANKSTSERTKERTNERLDETRSAARKSHPDPDCVVEEELCQLANNFRFCCHYSSICRPKKTLTSCYPSVRPSKRRRVVCMCVSILSAVSCVQNCLFLLILRRRRRRRRRRHRKSSAVIDVRTWRWTPTIIPSQRGCSSALRMRSMTRYLSLAGQLPPAAVALLGPQPTSCRALAAIVSLLARPSSSH